MPNEQRFYVWLPLLYFGVASIAIATKSEDLRGKNFVFAFLPNHRTEENNNTFQLVLTPCCGRGEKARVNVSTPSLDYFSTHLISDGGSLTVNLPDEIEPDTEDFFIKSTVVVSADTDIFVVAINGKLRTVATFPIIPTISLGLEYIIVSYTPLTPDIVDELDQIYPSEFVISSLSEATHVTILASNDFLTQFITGRFFELVIQPYTSILFTSEGDLTGTHVWSDKPVSIVSGNECTFVPSDYFACDHMAKHLPPVNRWGTRYILPPFLGRQSGYIYRVVAAHDSTTISYTDKSTHTVTIDSGEFIERDIKTSDISIVSANKPIIVAQYSKGNFTDGIGDPAMVLITPVEQYVYDVSFTNFNLSLYNITKQYLTIVLFCEYIADILFDGEPIKISDTAFELIGMSLAPEFCVVRKQLLMNNDHRLLSTRQEARFAAFHYGFDVRIAYGHPVAFGLERLACNGYNRYGRTGGICVSFDDSNSNHPIIACPSNITKYTSNHNIRQTISWDEPVAFTGSDDVIVVSSDHQSGSAFQIGETLVTYTATTASGEANTCEFYIIVKEPAPFNLKCNPLVIKQVAPAGETSVPVYFEAKTTGGTPMYDINYDKKPGSYFDVGSSTVITANVVDAVGKSATCNFKIDVITESDPSKLSDVVIISSVVGGVVVIVIVTLSVLCCCLLRNKSSSTNSSNYGTNLPHSNAAYVPDTRQSTRELNAGSNRVANDYEKRLEPKPYQELDLSKVGRSQDEGLYEVYDVCS